MLLLQIFRGQCSKRQLGSIYFPTLFIILIFWTIARALYSLDGGYTLNENRISRQGNVMMNPIGSWFFIIGTVMVALLLIPYFFYIYQQLKPTLKPINFLMLLGGIIGCVGLILVAIFPEHLSDQTDKIHSMGSDFAFIGLGASALFSMIILFVRCLQKQPWPIPGQFYNLFLQIIIFGTLIVFTDGSVNQWLSFLTVLIWCTGLYYILPEMPMNTSE
jgi:hypothetical protein